MRSIIGLYLFFTYAIWKIDAKTYYFNINKTNNEFMIYNRINLNNSVHDNNPSPLQVSELRNNVGRKQNKVNGNETHPLLDMEWDYNWHNITRAKLPAYIYRFYESISKIKLGPAQILFNAMPQNSTLIKFNSSQIQTNISDIELHFYHVVEKNLKEKSLILRLYQLETDINNNSLINPDSHKLLNVIYILEAETGWQVFKLSNFAHTRQDLRSNFTFFITISKPNEDQFILFQDKNRADFRTFLILKSNLTERSLYSHQKNDSACRKTDLFVDFEKLNWSKFIIAPQGYNAFSCLGHCSKTGALPNHKKVANSVPEFNKKHICCVATDYHPLPIMFYDKNGNVIVKIYEDMMVATCGCR